MRRLVKNNPSKTPRPGKAAPVVEGVAIFGAPGDDKTWKDPNAEDKAPGDRWGE